MLCFIITLQHICNSLSNTGHHHWSGMTACIDAEDKKLSTLLTEIRLTCNLFCYPPLFRILDLPLVYGGQFSNIPFPPTVLYHVKSSYITSINLSILQDVALCITISLGAMRPQVSGLYVNSTFTCEGDITNTQIPFNIP